MEEIYEKVLYNLYELINECFDYLNYEYKKELRLCTEFKQINSEIEQQQLDYEVSIYKNIEQKLMPFTQIFNTKQPCAYTLTEKETKIIRYFIGLFTNGEKQTIKQLEKKLKIKEYEIKEIIENIRKELLNTFFQEQIIYERNEQIKQNMVEKKSRQSIKEYILKQDINFLVMTNNMEKILRMMNINTIEDIININKKTIINLNIQYGYNNELILFPKRIIYQIHSLGLSFKNEELLQKLLEAYSELDTIPIDEIYIEQHALYIDSVLDILSAQQFEPEILNTLELNDQLRIDRILTRGYKQQQYLYFINNVAQLNQKRDNRTIKTIENIIEKEYPYLTEYEQEIIKHDMNNIFEIKRGYTEEEKTFIKTYFTEKN